VLEVNHKASETSHDITARKEDDRELRHKEEALAKAKATALMKQAAAAAMMLEAKHKLRANKKKKKRDPVYDDVEEEEEEKGEDEEDEDDWNSKAGYSCYGESDCDVGEGEKHLRCMPARHSDGGVCEIDDRSEGERCWEDDHCKKGLKCNGKGIDGELLCREEEEPETEETDCLAMGCKIGYHCLRRQKGNQKGTECSPFLLESGEACYNSEECEGGYCDLSTEQCE